MKEVRCCYDRSFSGFSGTLARPVTVRGYPGEDAILNGTTIGNGYHCVYTEVLSLSNLLSTDCPQAPNLQFANLITMSKATPFSINADNTRITNCEIFGCYNNYRFSLFQDFVSFPLVAFLAETECTLASFIRILQ